MIPEAKEKGRWVGRFRQTKTREAPPMVSIFSSGVGASHCQCETGAEDGVEDQGLGVKSLSQPRPLEKQSRRASCAE